MKKLFLMGFVALAFASCVSDKEVTPQTQEQKYEAAFESFIGGKVNPNVNWGFGNQQAVVVDAEGKATGMRGTNTESNNWGKYFEVPKEMTPEQKAKVKKFFDEKTLSQGISVNWSDFFVHQVSQTEKGKNMDYLYCGDDVEKGDHVNNFNGGSSTASKNVGDYLLPDGNNCHQTTYTDGIMFVYNSSTEYFSFHNSFDDTVYKKNFIMISGEVIDEAYPEEPSVAGMFFVGFDYEHDKTKMGEPQTVEKRDYKFNDWVIRVSPGYYIKSKRVMVEDLIATDLTKVDVSDWDFNDAVFDVAYVSEWENEAGANVDYAVITLWAAGGTKALTVAGQDVHALFGVNTSTMVNTNANGGKDNLTPVIFRVKNPGSKDPIDIPVKVNGIELKATTGAATQKFAVPYGTKWMKERKLITGSYTKFQEYVKNNDPKDWYNTVTKFKVYYGERIFEYKSIKPKIYEEVSEHVKKHN